MELVPAEELVEVVAELPAPRSELHLSACQAVLPQLPAERPAFPVIKGSQRNVGFFIHPLLSHAVFSLQRTYRMPKDIHVEPEKFAAELINRLEEVQKEREAEEKLEERLKRVRAVSDLLICSASLALCLLCTTGAFSCCGSNWGGQFPAPCHGGHWYRAPGGFCSPCRFHDAVPLSMQGSVSSCVKYQPWHNSAHFCHLSGAVDALHHLLLHPGSREFVSTPWGLCKRGSPSHRQFCVIPLSPTNGDQMTGDVRNVGSGQVWH